MSYFPVYCCVFVPGHQQSSRHTVGISRTEPVSRPPGHRSLLLLLRPASLDFLLFYYMTYMWCSDSLLLYTVYSSAQPVPLLLYVILQSYMLLCATLLILMDMSSGQECPVMFMVRGCGVCYTVAWCKDQVGAFLLGNHEHTPRPR